MLVLILPATAAASNAPLLDSIHREVRATNHLRIAKAHEPIRYRWRPERHPERRQFYLRWWQRQHRIARRMTWPPPIPPGVRSALLCIHQYEGAWNDPGAPYWGGLQMDEAFMRAYNPGAYTRWGTADHWPIAEQLEAGWRGVQARGYTPWLNTARMCGLL